MFRCLFSLWGQVEFWPRPLPFLISRSLPPLNTTNPLLCHLLSLRPLPTLSPRNPWVDKWAEYSSNRFRSIKRDMVLPNLPRPYPKPITPLLNLVTTITPPQRNQPDTLPRDTNHNIPPIIHPLPYHPRKRPRITVGVVNSINRLHPILFSRRPIRCKPVQPVIKCHSPHNR